MPDSRPTGAHARGHLFPGKGWLRFGPLFLKVMITRLFLYSFVHSTLSQRAPLPHPHPPALRWTLAEDATPCGLVLTELRQEAAADTQPAWTTPSLVHKAQSGGRETGEDKETQQAPLQGPHGESDRFILSESQANIESTVWSGAGTPCLLEEL